MSRVVGVCPALSLVSQVYVCRSVSRVGGVCRSVSRVSGVRLSHSVSRVGGVYLSVCLSLCSVIPILNLLFDFYSTLFFLNCLALSPPLSLYLILPHSLFLFHFSVHLAGLVYALSFS